MLFNFYIKPLHLGHFILRGHFIYSTRATDYSLVQQEIITQYDLMQLPTLTALTGKYTNDPMDFPNRQT